jgi:undecaprenyl-diphosphatase
MIALKEQLWGISLLKSLYFWMIWSQFWSWMIPILADVFVFVYPVYLAVLFIYWAVKKKFYYQSSALFTFFAVLFSICVNVGIQFFVDKDRPNIVLWLTDLKAETVLHKFLPTSSFPSDHAAVWMAFASAVLFRWLKNKDRKFVIGGIVFYIFSSVMSFARVTSWVHWPTDVIAGSIVWIAVTRILFYTKIFTRFDSKVNKSLIWLFNKIFRIKD